MERPTTPDTASLLADSSQISLPSPAATFQHHIVNRGCETLPATNLNYKEVEVSLKDLNLPDSGQTNADMALIIEGAYVTHDELLIIVQFIVAQPLRVDY